MHPLMLAVLLRFAELNALGTNAELDPPDRELGESADRLRAGKRHSVIASNYKRKPEFPKVPCKCYLYWHRSSRVQCRRPDEITARDILQGERITIASAQETELALEVSAPDIVWSTCSAQRRIDRHTDAVLVSSRRLHTAFAPQQFTDCTWCRPDDVGELLL